MLNIERLRIQLPAGLEHRASTIARLVGETASGFNPKENLRIEMLSIGPLQISPNATDHEIAQTIFNHISSKIGIKQ